MNKNREIVLTERPKGTPTSKAFAVRSASIPELSQGEVLVRSLFISVDPYMRGRMNDRPSYIEPFQIDQPITGGVVGLVEKSNSTKFKTGDYVLGFLNWADYSKAKADQLQKLDPNLAPISTALGVLGMPGMTAYFGLLDIGKPKSGETVVVSGAAGAVGTLVGQIAKIKGCKVVGIAGSDEKLNFLKKELKVDHAINYKSAHFKEELKKALPNGVDIYFDNVGGDITDEVMKQLNTHARIVICGQISMYNLDKTDTGPRNFWILLTKSALAQGFIVNDYSARFAEGVTQMAKWLKEGKLKYKESVAKGLEKTPEAFLGLFKGENIGKQIVQLEDI